MSNWSGFTLTNMGADLQAKINAGVTTLALTKIGLGSGSSSGSINALTQMVNKVQDVQISKITPNNNIVEVDFTLTNKGLNAAYKMSEMGIFATDPDEGEILFAYMTDSSPDTMPADGSATVVSLDVTLNITFSNTGNVSATLDVDAFIPWRDVETATSDAEAISNQDNMVASTSWVTNKLKKFKEFTSSQISDFKEKVIEIITENIVNILQITYRLDTNGFIKFGLFGGFTIQWGASTSPIAYPVAFSETPINFLFHKTTAGNRVIVIAGEYGPTLQYFTLYDVENNFVYTNNPTVNYVAFGQS